MGQDDISLSIPIVGEEEKAALREVIDSGWLSMGPRVQAFEAAFAALHGQKSAVAVNSCTAALHLACLAAGLGPGDEVIVPPPREVKGAMTKKKGGVRRPPRPGASAGSLPRSREP